MMKLTTIFLECVEDSFAIAWRVGTQRKGVVFVDDLDIESDSHCASELVAIRYLLFDKNVFKRELLTGKGITLEFSSPLIKKLYRGKTTKTYLQPYAHFLTSKLTGIELKLSSRNDEYIPALGDDVPVDFVDALDKPTYEIISTPVLGNVRLKKHAVDQYAGRLHSGEVNNPTLSLVGRLRHAELKRQTLPGSVIKHKLRKYGTVENLEVWGHDTSQLHYVIIRDPISKIGTLVTVYKRHPAF